MKAAAELGKFPHCRQPPRGFLPQHLVPLKREIGIGTAVGTSDTSPQLIQLGQSEAVGIFNNEGVHVRHVHAGFDNGRADQNIRLMFHQLPPDLRHFRLAHSPVCHQNPCVRQIPLQLRRGEFNGVNAVVDIVHLSAPFQFPLNRLHQYRLAVLHDISLHRIAILRRLGDDGHIPYAAHCHIQCAGNGRCRQGQHIHAGKHVLEFFLVCHAEPLFLVHDRQPQRTEFHVFLHNTVGADNDIRFAASDLFQNLFLPLLGNEAGQHHHVHRKMFKPADCRLIMLHGEHSGRHQNGTLFPAHDAFHCRTESHLCFPEAHVAAEQPFHRAFLLHVVLDLVDACQLIFRFHIGKPSLKVMLFRTVRLKGKAPGLFPLGIQCQQFVRHIFHRTADVAACLLPLRRGQPAEFYVGIFPRTDVFRHHVQLCDRHIQVFLAGILNGDIVLGHALQFQLADSQKPADTVQGMHHQIAGDNVRQCPDLLTAVCRRGVLCPV